MAGEAALESERERESESSVPPPPPPPKRSKKPRPAEYGRTHSLRFDNRESHAVVRNCGRNKTINSRYTLWNFVPKNLGEQFRSFMNKYFLLIALLELWSYITPVNPISTWGPLIVVFSVSAAKQAWEDIGRHKNDKKVNERIVSLFHQNSLCSIMCQDICPGNILCIKNDEEIPCDVILLTTSNEDGSCYVDTSALDGEADLKAKKSLITPPLPNSSFSTPITSESVVSASATPLSYLSTLNGSLEYVSTKENFLDLVGTLTLNPPYPQNETMDWNSENILLGSSFLRNTEWVYALAFATGEETTMALNRGKPFLKTTHLERLFDRIVVYIFIFQFFTIFTLGTIGDLFKQRAKQILWYVAYPPEESVWELVIIPLRFQLLFSIMVPISLKVTMDMVKSFFSKLIDWDMRMFDPNSNSHAHTNNSNVIEDLGQVDLILTDKTGTLTSNDLNFKLCCIDGVEYGNCSDEFFYDENLRKNLMDKNSSELFFLLNFVLCNTCIPFTENDGHIEFKCQSQDEMCLIETAARIGLKLTSRLGRTTGLQLFEEHLYFETLETLKFSSNRRKMCVIVRDLQTQKIFLFSKGADEAILPFVLKGETRNEMVQRMEAYSTKGYRTLCYSFREINPTEYEEWHIQFRDHYFHDQNREEDVALKYFQVLEQGSILLGVSAIEDALQEGVVETVINLRKAGIKFWMTTGDKKNTAVQTAIYANLISNDDSSSKCFRLSGKNQGEIYSSISNYMKTLQPHDTYSVVIDGTALEMALPADIKNVPSYSSSPSPTLFSDFLMQADSVICCRANPSQKAKMAKMAEAYGMCVLCVGDGSNDVAMIQTSSIGVAITSSSSDPGRHKHVSEGFHASKAADLTIPGFRHLYPLLLLHGRYAFFRLSFIIQFSIYKSFLLCVLQILFGLFSQFAGTNLFDSTSLMLYNAVYTCLPPLFYVLNKDVESSSSIACPHLLLLFKRGRWFNIRTMLRWYAFACYHSILVWYVSIWSFPYLSSQNELSFVVLSACLFLVVLTAVFETHSYSLYQLGSFLACFLTFYGLQILFSLSTSLCDIAEAMFRIVFTTDYWMMIGLVICLGCAPIFVYRYVSLRYFPSLIQRIQVFQHQMGFSGLPQCEISLESEKCICNLLPIGTAETKQGSMVCNGIHQPLLPKNSDMAVNGEI